VAGAENHLLYLKDVADVSYADAEKSYYARYNGKKAIFITASQKPGTNIFDIRDNLDTKISGFIERLPESIKLETVFDQAESVSFRLNGFFLNLLQGLFLVGIIVLLAVGMRASLIVIMAIPISILIGIGFLDMSHYGLEQMSIAGLVIALGLLVDNAIVVIENISRYIRKGLSRTEAAIRGTSQIGWAITSSTITTVFAFLPIMMMQNITGEFIRSMPLTVVYTLMASLLIALILTPYLSSKFLTMEDLNRKRWLREQLNHEIDNHYRRSLAFVLTHPARTLGIVGIVFILSLSLFPLVGISFFPKAEKPQFIININTPEGTNIGQTERVTEFIDSLLQTQPAVRHYAVNIGHGNPRIYYNVIPQKNSSRHAQFFVTLKERDHEVYTDVIKQLRLATTGYPGARIEIKEFEQGPPVEAPIAIRILGDNLSTLKEIAARAEKIITNTPGTVNVNNPLGTSRTDIEIKINREKAAILGVPLVDIDRTIRASVAGLVVGKYRDNEGDEYNILLQLFEGEKFNHRDFERIYVSSLKGQPVPLTQIATVQFVASPQAIDHYDLERNVTITADVEGNLSVDAATAQILAQMDKTEMPRGYRIAVGGELEKREESFGGMFRAVLIALIGIFAVLVLQFRSYSQPLIVFSAIPLAIIGSMFALLITGYSFSFTAFIGLTSLVGIVVNNSIILVDYTNQLRREGIAVVAALKRAGEVRFIPIVLTTATTIGGLLPLTLGGGSLWAPMGWTIIGGLLVSTVLTLLVVPVLYKLFTRD
ncbi:MAG: efflux RND transporter permease subunit, partial [Calditrichales bacterium]